MLRLRPLSFRVQKLGHLSLKRRFVANVSHLLNSSKQQHIISCQRTVGGRSIQCRWASAVTPHSVPQDPAETEALQALEQGTQRLEEGDIEGAKKLYQRSVEIKRTASALFNLGVTHYHAKEFQLAINAWEGCIALSPTSADAHTNLASAYILSPTSPRPDLAIQHLQTATELAPEDPEIAFNLAAVLEACGHLESAMEHYQRARTYGVEKAEKHIRNIGAKILGEKLKETGQLPDDETMK